VRRYIHTADAVFALVLFGAFALAMLMVLMTGAQVYQGIRDNVENRYSEETCLSYISMKARHYDAAGGAVYLGDVGGAPALMMREEYDGVGYITAIYYHDGSVRELYADEEFDFEPEAGLEIMAVNSLSFSFGDDGLLDVRCVGTGGGEGEISLSFRSADASAYGTEVSGL
jgi:hypothetical protein